MREASVLKIERGGRAASYREEDGQRQWAERLAPLLEAIDARPDIHEVKQFGSRTGPL